MNREAWDKFFERGILALVLAILVFGPLAMGAVNAWAFLVVQGLAITAMFLWALRWWVSPNPKLLWPPVCWAVLAFTVYATGRYLTADIEYVARLETIQLLIFAFLFFAIVNNLYRQEFRQTISFTLIFLATGISAYAVYQFLTHSNQVWNFISPYQGRASGTYISPNHLAGFLEMLLPLAVAYSLVGRVKPLVRVLLIYATVVMMAGMAVTFSRGGWVAVTVGLLALLGILACHRNHRLPALLLLIIFVAGGTFFTTKYLATTFGYIHRMEKTGVVKQLDWDVRRDMWGAAVRMWQDHYWWGVGPAHYDYRFREYRPESLQMRPDRVHNDYLNLLVDWGAAGGVIILAGMVIFVAGLGKTWNCIRPKENDFGRGTSNRLAFLLGASAGLLALAAHSLVDFNLHIPANAILGVTLLALLSSNLRFATERHWVTPRLSVKMLVTLALAAGVAYLSHQEWRRTNECVRLARAERLPALSPERATALETAFEFEPMNPETTHDLGEIIRRQSFEGGRNYKDLAKAAMGWYARGMKLDPYDGYNYLSSGMCLDWLDRHDEAGPYFDHANALDPNGYYTAAHVGWHYMQTGDYSAARAWLERSLRLYWQENVTASSYLDIAERKLVESASGQGSLPAGFGSSLFSVE